MPSPPDKPAGTPPTLGRVASRLRLRHLVFIEALAARGNIRQAAQDVFVTQPAASKLLQEIESLFDVRLFERTAHGIEITSHGAVLVHWARLARTSVDAAQQEMAALDGGWSGRVRVGVFPVAGAVLLPDAIALSREQRPGVQLHLVDGLEDSLIPLLETGELDMVIGRVTAQPDRRAISSEVLYEEPTVIISAPDHPLAALARPAPADFDRFDWILPSTIAPLTSLVTAALATLRASPPRIAVESSSMLMIVDIVRRTQLLSAIAQGAAARFVEGGQLAILPLSMPTTLHPVCIMTRRGVEPGPATLAFIDAVRRAALLRPRAGDQPRP